MDISGQASPLEKLRAAVKDAGGTKRVAALAGLPTSHLGNILCGRRELARVSAQRLRPHVSLAADVWLELLAPETSKAAEASP